MPCLSGSGHADAIIDLQEQLCNDVKLEHLQNGKNLCVYTDTYELHWAVVVMQFHTEELSKHVEEQRHEPLEISTRVFTKANIRLSAFEKEAFSIFQAFSKLDYFFNPKDDIHIFSDYRNFLFVYNPLDVETVLGRYVINKVWR